MGLSSENRRVLRQDYVRQEYRWVNAVDIGAEKANVLDCVETLLVKELGRGVRALFGGVRKLAEYLRESLRVCVIPADAFDPAGERIQIRFDTS